MDQKSWGGASRQTQSMYHPQQLRFQSNSYQSHNFANGGTGLWGNPITSSGNNWTSVGRVERIPRNSYPPNNYAGGQYQKNGQNVKGKYQNNPHQKDKGGFSGWRGEKGPNGSNSNTTNNAAQPSEASGEVSPNSEPQYRIFKRGDSLPGISPLNTSVTEGSLQKDTSPHRDGNVKPHESENSDQTNFAFENKNPTTRVGDLAKYHSVQAEYRLTKEAGPPHAPVFTVNLFLGTEEYEGQGTSIKRAQQAAAVLALKNTSFTKPPIRHQPKYNPRGKGQIKAPPTAVLSKLQTLADEFQETLTFTSQPVTISDPFLRVNPISIVNVHFGNMMFTGEGPNFHVAKTSAAITALKALIQLKKERELEKTNGGNENGAEDDSVKSPISLVHEMSLKRNLNVTFEIVGEEGPPHMKLFTLECKVGEFVCKGEGSTKQLAKKCASEAMISKLKEIPVPSHDDPNATFKLIQKTLNPNLKSKQSRKKKCPVVKDIEKQIVSPVSRLIQIAHVKKYKEPEYVLISKIEPPAVEFKMKSRTKKIKPHFIIQATVGPHVCQGSGSNKKDAKKAAADAALVVMGYAPSLPQIIKPLKPADESTNEVKPAEKVTNGRENPTDSPSKTLPLSSEKNDSQNVFARQIVPGVLVLKSEPQQQKESPSAESTDNKGTDLPSVMQKMLSTNCRFLLPDQTIENTKKLIILANLFNLQVTYSDFPKKNEFLSVVTLSTNPPQVAHGVGTTLDEAQNLAALKILEECALLDTWTPNQIENSTII